MTAIVDHPVAALDATLNAPGQTPEKVRIIAAYEREGKYLVAYPMAEGYDLGEIGATVKVPASMLSNIRPAQ